MIKTIDDLRKCYAVRADKEVFELFMDKCEEFGITWSGADAPRHIKYGKAVVFSGVSFGHLGHQSESYMINKGYKRLTLSNFKPTRTEYVQVTESIFDLRDELEHGELYERHVESIKATSLSEGSGVTYGYSQIKSELDLFKLAANGDVIYRRVEKVVDERQEFIDYCMRIARQEGTQCDRTWMGKLYDNGCRVALRANGEID